MNSYSHLSPPLPSLPSHASPETSPLDAFKLAVSDFLSKELDVPLATVYEGIETGRVGKGNFGDLTVALPRFRLKTKPQELAQALEKAFKPNDYLEAIIAQGAFVTFNANTPNLIKLVLEKINQLTYLESPAPRDLSNQLLQLDFDREPVPEGVVKCNPDGFGSNRSGDGKRVIIDFSSPNIAKPFHAGHLRSTIIGAFLANLYETNGWDVVRLNYLGDWGKQFGILAVGFEKYGNEELLKQDAVTHLYEVYVKINADGAEKDAEGNDTEAAKSVHDRAREFFVQMEAGDETALALWRKFRDLSIAKYKDTYARLNIYFDIYWGESQVSHQCQVDAVEKLLEKGIVEDSQGALILNLEKYKLAKTIARKKDGTFVYITRDIGGALERWERYRFDKSLYIVASQQDLHNAQLFKTLELMGYDWADRCQHINFGMVLGMSTRRGTAVFLDQILNESKDVMHEQMRKNEAKYNAVEDPEETSDQLGVTAVKIQDMAAKRINNYKFEWSRMTSFEGDTGPYLQYAHVRLSSVERKNAPEVVLPPPSERPTSINTALLTEPKAREIVVLIANYPDVVKAALKNLEPATIVTFAFRLCHAISSAWETLIVKNQPHDVALARLWLFVSAKDVLASAMKLLTLKPLTKM